MSLQNSVPMYRTFHLKRNRECSGICKPGAVACADLGDCNEELTEELHTCHQCQTPDFSCRKDFPLAGMIL